MGEALVDTVVEVAVIVVAGFGSIGVTAAGWLAERAGLSNVLAGDLTLGLWELWMGTIALFIGVYLLGYRNVWRRLLAVRRRRLERSG